jgi:hypothetical protein
MNVRITLFAFLCMIVSIARSQNDTTEVMKVIDNLFLAMSTNDSAIASGLFTDDAMLHTVFKDESGLTARRASPAARLPEAFSKPKKETWTEPIWNPRLHIQDGLATVWVDYAFYIDSTFSHCGVDAFHLMESPSGWKIFHLTDTRKSEGCELPKEILSRYQ